MPSVIVAGGGLAGLATAAALGSSGFHVNLFEARPFLGGRATSYDLPGGERPETIDNCQHILLRCCVNLLDFYARLGVSADIRFYREFVFLEPGGRRSVLRAGVLPAPLHFSGSFAGLKFLGLRDKLGIARAMLAIRRERLTRGDLDRISMLDWLREKRQTERAICRFWSQVLVSAINEELDRRASCTTCARGKELATSRCICVRRWSGWRCGRAGFAASSRMARNNAPISTCRRCPSNGWARWDWMRRRWPTRQLPVFTSGSTAALPICLTPPCWTAPSSGCTTRAKAATCWRW
jgi:hypothetical protein